MPADPPWCPPPGPLVPLTPGQRYPWPVPAEEGPAAEVNHVPDQATPRSLMAYFTDFSTGWYALTNSALGFGVGLAWPREIFPYAWFYRAPPYAVLAGAIPLGCLLLGRAGGAAGPGYRVPLFVAGALLVLAGLLVVSYRRNRRAYALAAVPTAVS